MKRIIFLFANILFLSAAVSCSNDRLRTGIDDLNSRLDAVQELNRQINDDITYSRGIITGGATVIGYEKNGYGDYTIKFSDNGEITVYSGAMEGEAPVISVDEDGWSYTLGGETYPLLGPDRKPVPVDGGTPQVRVNADGKWEYSFDGVNWTAGFGSATPTVGLFDEVVELEDGSGLVFKWHVGNDNFDKTVKLFDFDFTVNYGDAPVPVVFAPGEMKSLGITQTNVSLIEIMPTAWCVKVTESSIEITAPAYACETAIVLKVYSEKGYCKAVSIPVKAE